MHSLTASSPEAFVVRASAEQRGLVRNRQQNQHTQGPSNSLTLHNQTTTTPPPTRSPCSSPQPSYFLSSARTWARVGQHMTPERSTSRRATMDASAMQHAPHATHSHARHSGPHKWAQPPSPTAQRLPHLWTHTLATFLLIFAVFFFFVRPLVELTNYLSRTCQKHA